MGALRAGQTAPIAVRARPCGPRTGPPPRRRHERHGVGDTSPARPDAHPHLASSAQHAAACVSRTAYSVRRQATTSRLTLRLRASGSRRRAQAAFTSDAPGLETKNASAADSVESPPCVRRDLLRLLTSTLAVGSRTVIMRAWTAVAPADRTDLPAAADQSWWRDARSGMFIHWGPVSLRGTEIGWSRGDPVPIDEYDFAVPAIQPHAFDARQWVRIARDAGMRYLVLTTKHHDGFCLWDSALTDYDIMSTPFRRDVVARAVERLPRRGRRLLRVPFHLRLAAPGLSARQRLGTRPGSRTPRWIATSLT